MHPDYYGMLLFAQAAPPGSHLLRVAGASGVAARVGDAGAATVAHAWC